MKTTSSPMPTPSLGAVVPNAGAPAAAAGTPWKQGALPGAVAARRHG